MDKEYIGVVNSPLLIHHVMLRLMGIL